MVADSNAPQVVVTVALNWMAAPASTEISAGATFTLSTLVVTVTVAVALRVGSAALVATTW